MKKPATMDELQRFEIEVKTTRAIIRKLENLDPDVRLRVLERIGLYGAARHSAILEQAVDAIFEQDVEVTGEDTSE